MLLTLLFHRTLRLPNRPAQTPGRFALRRGAGMTIQRSQSRCTETADCLCLLRAVCSAMFSTGYKGYRVFTSYKRVWIKGLKPQTSSTLTSHRFLIQYDGHYPAWCLSVPPPHALRPTASSRTHIAPDYIQNVGTGTVLDLTNGSYTTYALRALINPEYAFSGQ